METFPEDPVEGALAVETGRSAGREHQQRRCNHRDGILNYSRCAADAAIEMRSHGNGEPKQRRVTFQRGSQAPSVAGVPAPDSHHRADDQHEENDPPGHT